MARGQFWAGAITLNFTYFTYIADVSHIFGYVDFIVYISTFFKLEVGALSVLEHLYFIYTMCLCVCVYVA